MTIESSADSLVTSYLQIIPGEGHRGPLPVGKRPKNCLSPIPIRQYGQYGSEEFGVNDPLRAQPCELRRMHCCSRDCRHRPQSMSP
jgi:hypothetical protein